MRNSVVTAGLLGALVLIPLLQPTGAHASEPDLKERLGKLEQRVAALERLLVVPSETPPGAVAEAESRLAAAENQLQHTENLHKKGFVTDLQLEADQIAVAQARQELQLAKAAQDVGKKALEIAVLDAQHNVALAKVHLNHSQRLRAKGYIGQSQVEADKLEVEQATQRLQSAQARLKSHE